jgi:hypothetical protein
LDHVNILLNIKSIFKQEIIIILFISTAMEAH